MTTPLLSGPLATILTTLIEDRMGLHYDTHHNELFASKIAARALESGFDSLLDYYYFLRYDDREGREFDSLVESLVVHETYFFREPEQLRTLTDDVLRPAIRAGRRPRVWCAACSTGEEPLTLAMLLAERSLLGDVEIVASDISEKALNRARDGLYGGRSLRALGTVEQAAWFVDTSAGLRVSPQIQRSVAWHKVNLLDDKAIVALGLFDVILCRNVLIYFSETTVARVAARLSDSLRPTGLLLVSASESLMRFGTVFECEERGGSFFYRKAG